MSTQQLVLHAPHFLAQTPEVTHLAVPRYGTEDEAIELLTVLNKTKSLSNWVAAYLLADITTTYGESTFARACEDAGIDPGTGGRLRWVGQTWPIELVRKFGNLTHKHFSEVTALMNELFSRNDQPGIDRLIEVLWRANNGYEKPNGRIVAYSSAWVKREAYLQVKGIAEAPPAPAQEFLEADPELGEEDDILLPPAPSQGHVASVPATADSPRMSVHGLLYHDPAIPMEDGTTRPALVIMLEDIPTLNYLVGQLTTNGLYGQYVTALLRISDTE